MTQITYGTTVLETADFAPASIDAMIRRGVSHFLGNEQASKVVGWMESEAKRRAGEGATAEQIAAAMPTDEEKAAKKAEFVAAAIEALKAGTVGASVRGPRVEPIEAAKLAIAKAEVTSILRAAGVKVPKADEKVTLGGDQFTVAELVARRLDKFGDRITKEAQKRIDDAAKKEKAAKASVASAPDKTADALGL
jgi:hypothetical protein